MDVVKAFNSELASLYESKPPISKAKMVQITKAAMKAIKYYKHVVMSVEKFIQKCKADYKIPGLYVIDSIVRQSRHQFGSEKDVFAPRFGKNIQQTFEYLFNCSDDDKKKVVRVIHLWLKSRVFTEEQMNPVLDYATTLGLDLNDLRADFQQKENQQNAQHQHHREKQSSTTPKNSSHEYGHRKHSEENVKEISTEEIEPEDREGHAEPPQEEKLADLISKNPQFKGKIRSLNAFFLSEYKRKTNLIRKLVIFDGLKPETCFIFLSQNSKLKVIYQRLSGAAEDTEKIGLKRAE